MYSAIAPKVTEFFKKTDGVLPRRLVETIYRFAQIFLRLVPAMMRDLFLQGLPGCFFRVLFRRLGREVNYLQAPMPFQPFFYFITGVVRSSIYPQNDLPSWTSDQQLFKPADCRVRILPVNDKRNDFFSGPQVNCPINVLRTFASRSVGNQGLLADRIPAAGDRSFKVDFALITSQGRDVLPTGSQFRQHLRGFKLEAQLLSLTPFDVKLAPSLVAPVERSHQLPRPALAVAKAKTLLNQNANRFDGPSAARLSAWHRFLLKQLTELAQFIRSQAALAMLPSPARIILQAVQAFLLVGLRGSD